METLIGPGLRHIPDLVHLLRHACTSTFIIGRLLCLTNEQNALSGRNYDRSGKYLPINSTKYTILMFFVYRGSDQAPFSKQAISSEPIPKTLSRVLNAAHVRQEWREKKRKLASGEDIVGEGPGKNKKRRIDMDTKDKKKVQGSGIQPGESLAHFNRCVPSPPKKKASLD